MDDHIGGPAAVLVSGGLDSAVLVGELVRAGTEVYPLYVRCGLYWERAEREYLGAFLEVVRTPVLRPLQVLEVPVADLYGLHWSLTGEGVPDDGTSDEAVLLPGRNVLLLAKALVWCHLHNVPTLALGTLRANPFPDATPGFLADYASAVGRGLGGEVRIVQPYRELDKAAVLRRGRGLPLGHTLSCLSPAGGGHCGRCNKCAERRAAFASVGLLDPTVYAGAGSSEG
jgi:7-cyano-7-deazaguanine synthase